MKSAVASLSLLVCVSALAEPKQLICSYNSIDHISNESQTLFPGDNTVGTITLPIGRQIAGKDYFCTEYPDSSGNYCDAAKKLRELKSECLAKPELPRYTFTFDTDDLNTNDEVNAEVFVELCGEINDVTPVQRVGLSATPSIISFSDAFSEKFDFNIDRETLAAGYATNRFLQCEVRDLDVSKNRI
jgi:hypothetical protein